MEMAHEAMIDDLLTVNEYSRSGKPLPEVLGIVIHWVANPNTTPKQNRDYWELRKNGEHGYGGGHYIVGEGEIMRCIPEDEVAYHVGAYHYTEYAMAKFGGRQPNYCTLGVELTHMNWEGEFHPNTLILAHELCADICRRYELDPYRDITTHRNVVGYKNCPKWFIDHPYDFQLFQHNVAAAMEV